MRYAIFSDIHGNLEALEAAVAHAQSSAVDTWVVLGDTLGYGANPNECFEWVLAHAAIHVAGNHERAVSEPELRNWFNPTARTAVEWTAQVLEAKFKDLIPQIPDVLQTPQADFCHSSLHEPSEFPYLFDYEDAVPTFRKMKTPVCFVGHTHLPGCICEGEKSSRSLAPGIFQLRTGERYVLNPGSVGQPRDGDRRLAFGIYDEGAATFEVVRLEYENTKAADKIRRAGLPRFLAERLL